MQKARDIGAEGTDPQFVVAVFDDWDALRAVLVDLEAAATMHSGAVLHARKDIPPAASSLGLLKNMAHLHFSEPRRVHSLHGGPARA